MGGVERVGGGVERVGGWRGLGGGEGGEVERVGGGGVALERKKYLVSCSFAVLSIEDVLELIKQKTPMGQSGPHLKMS